MKYRAIRDIPPNIKKGDIVEINSPLVEAFAQRLEPLTEEAEEAPVKVEDEKLEIITNPDRNALKARATELGITFASNIPTDRLIELIKEEEELRSSSAGEPDGEGSAGDGDDSSGAEENDEENSSNEDEE